MAAPYFTPERSLDRAKAIRKVKGRAPGAHYALSVFEVYSSCPVLTGRNLYLAIAAELERLNQLFVRLIGHGPGFVMPPVQDGMDTSFMLSTIFNPVPGADHRALL